MGPPMWRYDKRQGEESLCSNFERPPWKLKNHLENLATYMRILRHTPMVCCLLVLRHGPKLGATRPAVRRNGSIRGSACLSLS